MVEAPRAGGAVAAVGAAGFLGSALAAAARRADVPVVAYTRRVPFLSLDGALDGRLARTRTAFWLASSITPALAENRPDLIKADREAFSAFLRAVSGLPDPPRIVLVSSGGTVYDPAVPPPYAEGTPTCPQGAYGRAKLALERMLATAGLPPGRAVIVRVSNLYGPGQQAARGQGVVSHWLRAAAVGQNLTLIGDPSTTRDYVYVDDVADALLAVHAAAEALPPVLNIGSGAPTSLAELAEAVLAVVADPLLRLELAPARAFDVSHTWLDVRLAEKTLGWAPNTMLEEGLAAMWRWIRLQVHPSYQ